MMHQTIKVKFCEYLERAEELKKLIDGENANKHANPVNSPELTKAKPGKGGKDGGRI